MRNDYTDEYIDMEELTIPERIVIERALNEYIHEESCKKRFLAEKINEECCTTAKSRDRMTDMMHMLKIISTEIVAAEKALRKITV